MRANVGDVSPDVKIKKKNWIKGAKTNQKKGKSRSKET